MSFSLWFRFPTFFFKKKAVFCLAYVSHLTPHLTPLLHETKQTDVDDEGKGSKGDPKKQQQPRKKRKKVRSKQKNLKRDTRAAHLKPTYVTLLLYTPHIHFSSTQRPPLVFCLFCFVFLFFFTGERYNPISVFLTLESVASYVCQIMLTSQY